jgi:DNA (cytosine-5)-methyltransferase 1
MKHNGVSLFSGAMGLDIGIEKSGIQTRICVECDPVCVKTIKINRPNMPVLDRSIEDVSGAQILKEAGLRKGQVFVVYGGPPCQAFSTAGSRKSIHDSRGNLILEFLRIVDEIRPKYFVMENVRGLLSASIYKADHNGSDIPAKYLKKGGVVIYLYDLFKELGYTVSFALFDSANYGVPQKRERVIFFGNRGPERIPLPVPTHTEDGKFTGKKWKTLDEALKGLNDKKHHYVDFSESRKTYYLMLKEGQNWRDLPEHLQKKAMGPSYHLGGGKTGFYRRLDFKKPSPTLVTRPNMPATDLCHPIELRPLSIEEYLRIQEFPRSWKLAGNLLDQYRQVGNAVPIGLGKMAGKAVVDFHEGKNRHQLSNIVKYSRYHNTTDLELLAPSRQLELLTV